MKKFKKFLALCLVIISVSNCFPVAGLAVGIPNPASVDSINAEFAYLKKELSLAPMYSNYSDDYYSNPPQNYIYPGDELYVISYKYYEGDWFAYCQITYSQYEALGWYGYVNTNRLTIKQTS